MSVGSQASVSGQLGLTRQGTLTSLLVQSHMTMLEIGTRLCHPAWLLHHGTLESVCVVCFVFTLILALA